MDRKNDWDYIPGKLINKKNYSTFSTDFMKQLNKEIKPASLLLKEYLASVSAGSPKVAASFFAEDA